jgi:hypothetical protein
VGTVDTDWRDELISVSSLPARCERGDEAEYVAELAGNLQRSLYQQSAGGTQRKQSIADDGPAGDVWQIEIVVGISLSNAAD